MTCIFLQYANECEMLKASCGANQPITFMYNGPCTTPTNEGKKKNHFGQTSLKNRNESFYAFSKKFSLLHKILATSFVFMHTEHYGTVLKKPLHHHCTTVALHLMPHPVLKYALSKILQTSHLLNNGFGEFLNCLLIVYIVEPAYRKLPLNGIGFG